MYGIVHWQYAESATVDASGGCWDACGGLLFPQGLEWGVSDTSWWLPSMSGIQFPGGLHHKVSCPW